MAKKIGLNVYVDPGLAARLRQQADHYDGRLGDCLSAAILLFLESSPQQQAAAMQRVYAAALKGSVESLLDEIRAEQADRVAKELARTAPKVKKGQKNGGPPTTYDPTDIPY